MEKIIKKLQKLLSKAGLDESKIQEIVSEVESSTNDEEEIEETPVAEVEGETEEELPVDEPAPVEEALAENPPAEPEVEGESSVETPAPETVESEVVEESKDPNEVNPAELIPSDEPAPEVEPSVEPELPPQPDQTIEFQNKIEEQSKTIDGLLSRIDALEKALTESGIMQVEEKGEEGFGVDSSKVPANEPADDPMVAVLDRINGRRY